MVCNLFKNNRGFGGNLRMAISNFEIRFVNIH
jgi:hypothetical protein